jgi:hypothetical protein
MDSDRARWTDAVAMGHRAAAGLVLSRPERVRGTLGEALGTGIGQSIEFMDFREYEPGDDTRRVDWSAFARTDRLMIRRHREDVSPRLEIVIDSSRSMDLPGTPKADVALALAAACERGGARAGYRTSTWRSTDRASLAPASVSQWAGFDGRTSQPFAAPARASAGAIGGVRIVITDLLFAGDLAARLRAASIGVRWVIVMHVVARDDLRPPEPGPMRLEDRETGSAVELHVDAEVASAFEARVDRYLASCRDACRAARATYIRLVAEDVRAPESLLVPLVRAGVLRPR